MAYLIVAILFFGGMAILIALSNSAINSGGCIGDAGKCIYDQVKGIKVNGIALDTSSGFNTFLSIFFLVCIIVLAVFVANLIYSAFHNKPPKTPKDRWGKLPYWLDDKGQAGIIIAIGLFFSILIVGISLFVLSSNQSTFSEFNQAFRSTLAQFELILVKMGVTL